MNKKINEYCLKIEKKYGVKTKKMFHRWSYTTGRSVDMIAEDTNVL